MLNYSQLLIIQNVARIIRRGWSHTNDVYNMFTLFEENV